MRPNSSVFGLCLGLVSLSLSALFLSARGLAQEGLPWSDTIVEHTRALSDRSAGEIAAVSKENWQTTQDAWRSELQEMLGLTPLPERTDLKTTTTGSLSLDGVTVDRLHYQSRPGLYVAANLYKPLGAAPASGWPAVLYVCGHANVSEQGRLLGNKTSYQHHGIWLARHGVVCLMIDTIQLGEFHGEHHGTYKLGRWDWYSRGYTPAGVEAWNAIRGIDLLCDLPDVNADRIGITGRSGGGAYSWFAAALDERIRVAVPVAGITDLQNHTVDGCVEGHCDCMYFVNYFGWDYAKLAALIAPRALLLANSDSDGIFPLDGVMRIHQQLAGLYDRLGAAENYGVLITPGPHKDTQELQVGAFKWLLKNLQDGEPLIDTPALKEIEPAALVAFEMEIPKNEMVTSVSSWFVASPKTVRDGAKAAELWKTRWLPELQRLGSVPNPPEATFSRSGGGNTSQSTWQLFSGGDKDSIQLLSIAGDDSQPPLVHLLAATSMPWDGRGIEEALTSPAIAAYPGRTHYIVRWRGADWFAGASSVKQQHMLVRRLYLLGETPDELMLNDLLAAIRWIGTSQSAGVNPRAIELVGEGREAALVELAGLLAAQDERISIAKIHAVNRTTDPLLTPALLGVLRVCDYQSLHAAASHLLGVEDESRESSSGVLLVNSESEPQQATGMRIVEVNQDSAKFWVRATRWPLANLGDLPQVTFEKPTENKKKNEIPILPEQGVDGLRFAVPGVPAQVRVGLRQNGGWRFSPWQPVAASTDYSAVIEMEGLSPGSNYEVRTQVRRLDAAADSDAYSSTLSGQFRTLPAATDSGNFKLAVGTCQAFDDRDGPHGFDVYRTMLQRKTDAFVMAGDVVYYDALARSNELAYYHWQRTYSLPTLREFHRQVPTFFLKDDHDTYMNDTWPGTSLGWTGAFTFEDGQRIFIEQTGLPKQGYRTFQITRDLQIWLMEGRDYRSPNNAPDGPEKSIWGETQKQWLKETMDASTAKFRVIISPTPIVGPDRDNKSDNHSNKVFAAEGSAVRRMLASYPNTVSVCGDRHWQFHSIDPQSGLHEFSVGPVSDRHAGGWKQEDFRPEMHQFLRVAGGYLEIELSGSEEARELHLRHLDTHGAEQHSHTLR